MEECIARLQSREKTSFWRSTKTYVSLEDLDEDSASFHIKRTGNQYGTYFADGYLTYWDDTHTQVTGEVRQRPEVYNFLWIALPFLAIWAIVASVGFLAIYMAGIVAVVFFIGVYEMAQRRNQLAAMIEETLGY